MQQLPSTCPGLPRLPQLAPPPSNTLPTFGTCPASQPAFGRAWAACAWQTHPGQTMQRRYSWPPRGNMCRHLAPAIWKTRCEACYSVRV